MTEMPADKPSELTARAKWLVKQAVAKAGEHVNTAVRCIASKKKHATGLAKEGLQKMEERARHLRYMQTFQKEILEALVNEEGRKAGEGGG